MASVGTTTRALCSFLIFFSLCTSVPATPNSLRLHNHRPSHAESLSLASTKPWLKEQQVQVPNLPVGGNIFPLGIFYTEIDLGTPGRAFNVAIDTGSFSLIVSKKGCKGCRAPEEQEYDPEASSTASQVLCSQDSSCACVTGRCTFSNSYQTCNLSDPDQPCTVSGDLYQDAFGLAGLRGKSVRFGTIDFQTSNFQQFYVIHGVMGVASEGDSNFGTVNPIQQLHNDGLLSASTFALCFKDNVGKMTLGGTDPLLHNGGFQYTPMIGSELYVINMTDITLGGSSIGLPQSAYTQNSFGGCVVDSGTNILLLPDPIYNGLSKAFAKICQTTQLPHMCDDKTFYEGYCFPLTASDIAKFPPISLDINGVELVLNAQDYLLQQTSGGDYCYGVSATGNNGFLIIGDTVMQNYYTLFDVTHSTLAWAPVNAQNCFA